MFRQQADLQIEICTAIRLILHSVLSHEHEGGQEDRFDQCNGRERNERRIEFLQRGETSVDERPKRNDPEMDVNEGQAAGEARD